MTTPPPKPAPDLDARLTAAIHRVKRISAGLARRLADK